MKTKAKTVAECVADAHARWERAYTLKKQGLTFAEVGEHLGVGAARARGLYINHTRRVERGTRPAHWADGLNRRTVNCLNNFDIHSREGVMAAYLAGSLRPGLRRNLGWVSYKEIAVWLGLPEPQKTISAPRADADRTLALAQAFCERASEDLRAGTATLMGTALVAFESLCTQCGISTNRMQGGAT